KWSPQQASSRPSKPQRPALAASSSRGRSAHWPVNRVTGLAIFTTPPVDHLLTVARTALTPQVHWKDLMKLRGLQHVSSPYPAGRRADVRGFYGGVLGLTEIPQPTTLKAPLVWYSAGDGLELHFFPGDGAPGSTRHFCLDVDDLDETRQRLAAAGFEPYDDTPILNR